LGIVNSLYAFVFEQLPLNNLAGDIDWRRRAGGMISKHKVISDSELDGYNDET